MEATREIYWNVGHWVIGSMYLLATGALLVFIWGIYRRISTYRLGKPLNRFDQFPRRVTLTLRNTLGQARVFAIPTRGPLHATLYWGFLVLFIGTVLTMVQVDLTEPLLGRTFLKGTFYKMYSLALDVAGCIVVIALCALIFERSRKGGECWRGALIIYALLLSVLLTGFVVEGLRIAASELHDNPGLARFSPVGMLVGRGVLLFGATEILRAHQVFWWTHCALAMAFLAALPFSKLCHVFTTTANYFFSDLNEKGTITNIMLEDENVGQFGASAVTDLTWKDILDADACTGCARCQERCPAWATGKALSPMNLIRKIGEMAFTKPDASLAAAISLDEIWSCTTCFACQQICPVNIEHVSKIIELRRNQCMMESTFPGTEVRTATGNIERDSNPFGLLAGTRGNWADALPVTIMGQDSRVDILYFVGCYASFDRRNQEVARSFVEICAAAGIRVGILGKQERCCGEPIRKLGNEYLYQVLARENIGIFKSYGVKKIVATCPHCFNALSRDYRDLGCRIEVEHHTTFLHHLLSSGMLNIAAAAFDCTYHDSCYIGRYKDTYSPQRALLRAAGGQIREMSRCRDESFCCGGGGGRIFAEEKLGTRISVERVSMAADTGAPLLVSNCPFCLTMFEDGIKAADCEHRLQVRDMAELLAARTLGRRSIAAAKPNS